jgi:hypothetical protein
VCAGGAGADSLLFPAPENGGKGNESDGKGKARVLAPVRSVLWQLGIPTVWYTVTAVQITAVYRKVFRTIQYGYGPYHIP